MLTYDKKEIAVGCVVKDKDNSFRRVDYVGKEWIICANGTTTLEGARNTEKDGFSFSRDWIDFRQFTLVEYLPLGVYDKFGKEYHQFDEVEFDEKPSKVFKVFGAVKSRNGDGTDYIFLEWQEAGGGGGWNLVNSRFCNVLPHTPSLVGQEVKELRELLSKIRFTDFDVAICEGKFATKLSDKIIKDLAHAIATKFSPHYSVPSREEIQEVVSENLPLSNYVSYSALQKITDGVHNLITKRR